jgi:uroporphyrinogen-III synthase
MATKKTKSTKGSSTKGASKSLSSKSKTIKATPSKKTIKKPVVKKSSAKKVVKKASKAIIKKKVSKPVKKVVKSIKKAASPKKKVAVKKVIVKKTTKALPKAKPVKKAPIKVKKVVVKAKKVEAAKAKKAIVAKPVIAPKVKEVVIKKDDALTSAEKYVKIGVKTKKQLVVVTPQPVIEVSNFPKHKVKTILISQPKPENDKNPYYELSKKYNLIETFRQFIKIEGVPVKDFRLQRIDILEHKAVILTSRMAVDHYFRMCNEMRVTVPESMKYFCINEATAYYLQKYIQYRKRKIFFGHQTIQDLVDVIRKNKEEKFLLPAADVHKEQICDFLDAINIKYTKAVMYRTVSADLSDIKNLNDFDVLAFFTPAGINSLKHNFPNFKQGNTRIACFGATAANTLKKHGYRLDIYAPNPKNPSMSGALDEYLKESNKR